MTPRPTAPRQTITLLRREGDLVRAITKRYSAMANVRQTSAPRPWGTVRPVGRPLHVSAAGQLRVEDNHSKLKRTCSTPRGRQ